MGRFLDGLCKFLANGALCLIGIVLTVVILPIIAFVWIARWCRARFYSENVPQNDSMQSQRSVATSSSSLFYERVCREKNYQRGSRPNYQSLFVSPTGQPLVPVSSDFPFYSDNSNTRVRLSNRASTSATHSQNQNADVERVSVHTTNERGYSSSSEFIAIQEENLNRFEDRLNSTWNTISELISNMTSSKVSPSEYIEDFKAMLQIELDEELEEIKNYNQTNVQLSLHENCQFYFSINEKMDELCGAIDENQLHQLILKPEHEVESSIEINGKIIHLQDGKILIEVCNEALVDTDKTYSLHFQLNRNNIELQLNALSFIEKHNLYDCLLDHPAYRLNGKLIDTLKENYDSWFEYWHSALSSDESTLWFECFIEKKETHHYSSPLAALQGTSAEQNKAVKSIVNGSSYPLPYLLTGPAGTGKTETLVAAIQQIVEATEKNILVCAKSNSACDEITERVLSILVPDVVFRLYASSYNVNKINSVIKTACNIDSATGKLYNPPTATLYKYRVVICTLSTASLLTTTFADPSTFNADHFHYIFIDECTNAEEPMALIPIAGLCSSPNAVRANIVLSGDPKLLSPTTKSTKPEVDRLKVSLMERLLNMPLYRCDSQTGKFNYTFITRLTENYRSHPHILRITNEIFYENQMEAKAPTAIDDYFTTIQILPNDFFPVIFKSITEAHEDSHDLFLSLFNDKEVETIVELLQKMLVPSAQGLNQSAIAIISPHKKQCKKISLACRDRDWNEIAIGRPETLQGKEKAVVIVSTGRNSSGFINNSRLINFIVTRAQKLLVVVGDPHILQFDSDWQRIIKYCLVNNSFIQSDKVFSY